MILRINANGANLLWMSKTSTEYPVSKTLRLDLLKVEPYARGTVRGALDTGCIEIARARRDALAKADELFRRTLQSGKPTALDSYEAAKQKSRNEYSY